MKPISRSTPVPAVAFRLRSSGLVVLSLVTAGSLAAALAPVPMPAWDKSPAIPTQSEAFRDRLSEPQNHFLLDGEQGFVSGREFYQVTGEAATFLWFASPFLRFGPDRTWQTDSLDLVFHATGGSESSYPILKGDIGYQVFQELRLHAGLDQNDALSSRSYPSRLGLVGKDKRDALAWLGGNLPPRSQAEVGGAFEHRGALLAVQANQGWWWTASPVSGRVYPWEGYNAELLYRVGDDFDLSLVDQEWDSPIDGHFYHAHYGRSELNMSFLGASQGDWIWRLDVGFQRKEMISDSVFAPFVQKSYPTRFRYHQNWQAPDSIPFQMISQGSMGFRDRILFANHTSEFHEKWGSHQVGQTLKAYYRHPMQGYQVPTESFPEDSAWRAESKPGLQARGLSGEVGYTEKRRKFQVGWSGIYAMEWEAPLFHLDHLDSVDGGLLRSGRYAGSDYLLQNVSILVFAGGGLGFGSDGDSTGKGSKGSGVSSGGFWRVQAGWREFWGHDAEAMEFLPSREWVGGGGGWAFPFHLSLDAQVNYVGAKEVRGWGPVFTVPAHVENSLALSQAFWDDSMKLSLSLLHAFGEDIQEQPNGNPLRFRILGGVSGSF